MQQSFISKQSRDYSLLDNNTGEVLKFFQTKKVSVDEFIMVFFSCIPAIMDLRGQTIKILMCCWKFSTFNPLSSTEGNVVSNNRRFKDFVRQCGLDIKDASIDNAISLLCKKNLLIKICRGEYILNPKFFFKGTISQRSKLNLNIEKDPVKYNNGDANEEYCFFISSTE